MRGFAFQHIIYQDSRGLQVPTLLEPQGLHVIEVSVQIQCSAQAKTGQTRIWRTDSRICTCQGSDLEAFAIINR